MKRKLFYGVLFLLILIPSVIYGIKWVQFRLSHVISEAAFVESDEFTKVAFKVVSGKIEKLYKEEGDLVQAGEPLAKLEDRDYRVKLEEITYEIEAVKKELEALRIKRDKLREQIDTNLEILEVKERQLIHEIRSLEANVEQVERDYKRYLNLYKQGVIPRRNYEELETQLRSLKEKLEASRLAIAEIRKQKRNALAERKTIAELEKQVEAGEERLRALYARKQELENLLDYTILRSPVSGYIVKRFFNEGEFVAPGQYVYAIYDPNTAYILVLLDERQLEGVKVGSRVKIKIDAYPDKEYEGVVKEIMKATASKFAVIPRDITAGEFTKVSQRIPVKVEITKGDKSVLKLGMSAEVVIEKK